MQKQHCTIVNLKCSDRGEIASIEFDMIFTDILPRGYV